MLFPPFVHMVKVTVRARKDDVAEKTAHDLALAIRGEDPQAMVGGPAPAMIIRMRGYFRYNIMLKGEDRAAMCSLLKKVFTTFKRPHGVLIAVDVDPMNM